jgi:hypothetical protein
MAVVLNLYRLFSLNFNFFSKPVQFFLDGNILFCFLFLLLLALALLRHFIPRQFIRIVAFVGQTQGFFGAYFLNMLGKHLFVPHLLFTPSEKNI